MNVPRCPRCQASLPADTGAFCGHCGQRLMQLAPAPGVDSAGSASAQAEAPSPDVTQRLEPPAEAIAPRAVVVAEADAVRRPPATVVKAAPRAAAPPEEDDEFAKPRGPRLVNMLAVALAAAALGAGAGIYLYRRWQAAPAAPSPAGEPMARRDPSLPSVAPPVTPSAAMETPPSAAEPAASGRSGYDRKPSRPAKTSAGAEPVRTAAGTPGRPTPDPAPSPTVAKTAPAPVGKKDPPAAPAGGGSTVAVTPTAPAAPSATPATPAAPSAAAPKPTPSAPVVLPDDDGERAPLDEEALAEQRQAEIMAEGIQFVVKTHYIQWRGCYERAFKNETTPPTARVEIEFTIDRQGRAQRVKTVSNNTDSAQLASCLEHLLAEWQFPRPPAGEFATSYPFRIAGG